MDRIWWKQITKASLFTGKVIEALAAGDSVILSLPRHVPWYVTLADIITEGIVEHGIPRSVDYIDGANDPGKYLLDNYCKKETRLQYRVGKSYAAFLAEQDSITLNSTIVWVKNLDEKSLGTWVSFIHDYIRKLPGSRKGGLFILEIRGDYSAPGSKHLQCISFSSEISAYDKFTFCTLVSTTASIDNRVRQYLAELVSSVCSDDVELCAQCFAGGTEFAKDPVAYLEQIAETEQRSDGTPFEINLTPDEQRYRIWDSQIRMIFPLIERYRMQFINDHWRDILKELPQETAFGERIETPEDVEIGLLYYLTYSGAIQMRDNNEFGQLRVFKDARNDLAHLNFLPFDMVCEILTGKRSVVTV